MTEISKQRLMKRPLYGICVFIHCKLTARYYGTQQL